MFQSGFLTIGRFRGVPIRLHWSTALGALFFGGFRFVPAFWLAFVVLVVVHELGHALVVQRLGHRALAVDVTGFGGLCHWDARGATSLDHSVVAWGGVLAQFALLLLTLAFSALFGRATSAAGAQIVSAFTVTNLWLIGLNLLPIAPLDGKSAWRLFAELRKRRLSPWSLLQRWVVQRRTQRQPSVQDAPAPKPASGKPTSPKKTQPKAAPSGGSEREQPSPAAQAELARVFAKVAEEARRARKPD